jgi:hypothetical protein
MATNEQRPIIDGRVYLFRGFRYRANVPSAIPGTVASFTRIGYERHGPSLWLEEDGRITVYTMGDWGHYDDLTPISE